MNFSQLKETLMDDAHIKGICKEGYKRILDSDMDKMIEFYLESPDWCLERSFPDLETLSEAFAKYEDKGVYINKVFHGETFSHLQAYIFHNCKGTIRVAMDYERAVIPMLYFANGCNLTVSCTQRNNPPIRVPLYVTDEGDNCVSYVIGDDCNFVRHTIKIIEP